MPETPSSSSELGGGFKVRHRRPEAGEVVGIVYPTLERECCAVDRGPQPPGHGLFVTC